MNREDRSQYLYEVHCIEQVLNHYVIGLDTLHIPLMQACFTDDARVEIPGTGVCTPAEYAALCEKSLRGLDATHHQIGPVTVEINGDSARAHSYLTAQHVLSSLGADCLLTIGAWYDDELVHTGEGWKIASRVGTPVWFSGNPAVLGLPMEPGAFPRTPGRECPEWLRKIPRRASMPGA